MSLEIEASNGIIILVNSIPPIEVTREIILVGSLQGQAAGGLANLTDQQIIAVLEAATEVGKMFESKGFKVNY